MEEVTETAAEEKPEAVVREEVVVNGNSVTSPAAADDDLDGGRGEESVAASSHVRLAEIKPEKVFYHSRVHSLLLCVNCLHENVRYTYYICDSS